MNTRLLKVGLADELLLRHTKCIVTTNFSCHEQDRTPGLGIRTGSLPQLRERLDDEQGRACSVECQSLTKDAQLGVLTGPAYQET